MESTFPIRPAGARYASRTCGGMPRSALYGPKAFNPRSGCTSVLAPANSRAGSGIEKLPGSSFGLLAIRCAPAAECSARADLELRAEICLRKCSNRCGLALTNVPEQDLYPCTEYLEGLGVIA